MPSHTFTRVGYWQNSIDSNRAAAAASRRVGQTVEELHASDYQVYAYLQTAQDEAARKVLEALPEIASRFDPRVVVSGAAGPDAGYFALAAIPARYAVRRDWQRATELQPRETPFPYTDAITWFARGIAAARLHDAAKASVAALQDIRTRLEKAKESYWAGQAEIQRLEVNAWSSLTEGRKDLALTTMKSAAEMEDGTDKKAITPGPLAPARELFGEMLLEINQPTGGGAGGEQGSFGELVPDAEVRSCAGKLEGLPKKRSAYRSAYQQTKGPIANRSHSRNRSRVAS